MIYNIAFLLNKLLAINAEYVKIIVDSTVFTKNGRARTDMGFQTVSSSFIALPSSKSKLNINKPIFRYANGSPDCTSFKDLQW